MGGTTKFRKEKSTTRAFAKSSSIIPNGYAINKYDFDAIMSSLETPIVEAVAIAPRFTDTTEKEDGWTSVKPKFIKRASILLSGAEPWGPTLGGILKSNKTFPAILSVPSDEKPASIKIPVSESTDWGQDYWYSYKSLASRRCAGQQLNQIKTIKSAQRSKEQTGKSLPHWKIRSTGNFERFLGARHYARTEKEFSKKQSLEEEDRKGDEQKRAQGWNSSKKASKQRGSRSRKLEKA